MSILMTQSVKQLILNISIAILIPTIAFLSAKIIAQSIIYSSSVAVEQEILQTQIDFAIFYISFIFGVAAIIFGFFASRLNTGFILGGFTTLGLGYLLFGLSINIWIKLILSIILFATIVFIDYRYKIE